MSGSPLFLRAALLAPLLWACTPRTAVPPTVQSSTPVTGVSFYPHQTGLSWTYQPEGEASGGVPYTLTTQGATVYGAQPVQATQLTGRGAAQTWYRTYDADGVHLHGLVKPGVNVQLTPPWLEYPSESAWRVGLTWEGQSEVTIRADDGTVQGQGTLTYRYLVQDRRSVQVPGGTFTVWVVTRQIRDTLGGLFPATQQLWFTPFVGEIRTPEGLLLTARNFAARPGGQP
ncbi:MULTISPECIES: hypothetical protein [Deinococcus]|uniref:DUF3108 domain-containing protein n=1 Tax=Deinococcus rufus TaxID=2136097 RepID=A0ABV7ZGF5_9DEIO|nr:hypothetical protein [Deinococcus sp. AB2017081]WQE93582.1 hypothetical protein U2P90_09145 [Deinococcus sp. AB2017081]